MTFEGLGQLEQVDLKNIWAHEASDFTPWLAEESNLKLLGDTIRIDLELEAQEKNVGPFRADILCKDTATGNWVLIENQLERTDHPHLGQLLTYAAGLKAVTIVWIADRFRDEHRAALDWLNEITDDRFNFFGLEVELWKIGNSSIAPKFNIVCKPNEWTNPPVDTHKLTDTQILYREYWTELRSTILDMKGVVKPNKPLSQSWTTFALGRSNFNLHASVSTQKRFIAIGMSCFGADAKQHFHLLEEDKASIEREVGCSLEWEKLPHRKESRIALRRPDVDPAERTDWPGQHKWMAEKLDAMYRAFSSRVKKLNAADHRQIGIEANE